jgi:uncharacterized protein YcfL
MKNILKILGAIVFAALIVFLMATCETGNNDNDTDINGPTHYSGAFKINKEQVWQGTESNKLSEVYEKFDGDLEISVNVYWPDDKGKYVPSKVLGSGIIEKGLLTCDIPEPESEYLMEWTDFKFEFSQWNNIDCVPKVKGTYLRLVTSNNEWLNREKMSGSNDSLWLESILYIYVDMDCKITGTPGEGIRPGDAFYETPENLYLTLNKGWNTVCRKQLLVGDHGIETDSVKIKNPNDFKWALRTIHP